MAHNSKGAQIRSRVLNILAMGSTETLSASALAAEFGVSRSYIYALLSRMVKDGVLTKTGRKYELKPFVDVAHQFPLQGLSEDIVLYAVFSQYLDGVPERARAAFDYIFSEMLNNAIEHSGGESVKILLAINAVEIRCAITDDGVGIFNKIQRALNLADPRFAVFELYKGKVTTDTRNHTGEGIFFSSKIATTFNIFSGGLLFVADPGGDYPLLSDYHSDLQGTTVAFSIRLDSSLRTQDVFDQYTDDSDNAGFSKTVVPVRVLDYRERASFVSRSQAKRLMARFDQFKNIVLDFAGVEEIGQGFADEIFRVFVNSHPDSIIIAKNMKPAVKRMAEHVRSKR